MTIKKELTKGQQTRQRIVAEAASVFNQRGYEGCSLAHLMEATGLEKGGIYRHFSSKEELAAEAFDYAWSEALRVRTPELDADAGAVAWLKALIANFAERKSPVAGGCPLLNTATESDDGNLVLRAMVSKALRAWVTTLQTVIAGAAKRGEIRPGVEPAQVATLIVAALEGALMMSRLERSVDPLRRIRQHLNDYLDTAVAMPPRKSRKNKARATR
jgi:TetR/AcrR family transcriptional regulator, transcriptional repressor for nem operon